MHNLFFGLLHVAIALITSICIYLFRVRSKRQIHYTFLGAIIFSLVWSIGYLLEVYMRSYSGQTHMAFVNLWFLGLCFTPVFILLMGIVYAKTKITFFPNYCILFIIPIISVIILLTNNYHNLFFVYFSPVNTEVIYGKYFIIHSVYSYSCTLIGIGYLVIYSVKNSGFFSKQSILIVIGASIPLFVNIIVTLKLFILPAYTTAISFSLAILIFVLAIFRYNFLSVAPIALRTIVDRISDCFIVVNEDCQVIDYNRSMKIIFHSLINVSRNKKLDQLFGGTCLIEKDSNLIEFINMTKISGMSVTYQKRIKIKEKQFDKHFSIEVTPIISKGNYLGNIILFKDVTDNVKHIAAIEEKHAIIMEQERLASLGQLIGGIAHNLKTPIMSIAGAAEGLRYLVEEYEQSVGDENVTIYDHKEIASEMYSWINKIKPYCSYMSDIIDTVKGQTLQFSANLMLGFSIAELVKRIELLLKYELIRHKCELNTVIKIISLTELYGDINSLVQIFDNIIINAIQAYEGNNGVIDFVIEEIDNEIHFTITDYAKGIPDKIKEKLLKEMVTTKGTAGTGLGLYMSYATIKGRFGGKMWFSSEEGKGTTFYIQLPRKNSNAITGIEGGI